MTGLDARAYTGPAGPGNRPHLILMDDPSPTPKTEPQVRVKTTESDLTYQEESSGDPDAPAEERQRSGQPRSLRLALAVLLVAALVGLASWWLAGRQGRGAAGPATVPEGAVTLINSSTPITLDSTAEARADVINMEYEPEEVDWNPALREAGRALKEGRYSAAISQYSALVGSTDPAEPREALWGLAEAYAASGQYDLAVRSYSLFSRLDDPRAARTAARIGQIYERQGKNQEAAEAYGKYARLQSPARHAVMLRQARLLGNSAEAEKLYNEVIDGKPADIDLRQALAGLAALKMATGKHVDARKLYERLGTLEIDQRRPVLDDEGVPPQVLAAGEAVVTGDLAGARKGLISYISSSKYTYGRYLALNALLKLDSSAVVSGTVAPMEAAHIAYDAGFYGLAITFMDQLRSANADIDKRPEAALLTGKAYELSGDPASAYNWYTATVQTYPTSPHAREAIRRAGDALEEQGAWDAAMAVYRDGLSRYPGPDKQTAITQVHAGVLAYRLGNADEAFGLLPVITATKELTSSVKAEAAFWRGKLLKARGDATWKDDLGSVVALVPGSYLGFRAAGLLAVEPDGGPRVPTAGESNTDVGALGTQFNGEGEERSSLLAWASSLAPSVGLTGTHLPQAQLTPAPSALDRYPEAARAAALLNLGLRDDAYRGFRGLAEQLSVEGNAPALAQLMIYARYHADSQTAMRLAERLSGMDKGDPTKQPLLLLRTLYPTPYDQLVTTEATTRDIDPLLVYALMRQESQFVPDARSHADARGLTQVIPSTGEGIAQQLGDASYSVSDLFLPYVSIRYGTYYLASNLPQFDRKMLPALAAYNGGPGNAERWLAGSALIDPDLYAERIDLFETGDYLEKVYRNYSFYRLAYGK
ncbi:MAG TPA: transglycosylase SLT domain-containing protein [Chloroflexia bacterium]|nr:transglycosylase SLT domain-containing protein [Chloroflexia bacterium]